MDEFVVCVCFKSGAPIIECFKDEKKARSFYADALVKWPTANVEFIDPRK